MQLYLQSAVVERGVGADELPAERARPSSGAVFANLIAGFIIIATGATLYSHGDHTVSAPPTPRKALEPFAGRYAEVLFGVGLLGASLLAAAILPIATSYVVSETLGFEKGIGRRRGRRRCSSASSPAMIVIGAVVAMIPGRAGDLAAGRRAGGQRPAAADQPVLHLAARVEARADGRARGTGRSSTCVAGATVIVTSALSLLPARR